MSLIDDVKAVCDRLGSRGWRDLLLAVTGNRLDIRQATAQALGVALGQPLPAIDRQRVGFNDFHRLATRGVTPGRPEQSLLYHALASPNVHPAGSVTPSADPHDYPTLDELDTLENYVYSLAAGAVDPATTLIAVFAYQYREASRTAHLRHADMAYSRTGVARVGTAAPRYDASRRGFWVVPEAGGDAIAALPARYGVFLARRAKPGPGGTVQGGHSGAADEDFIFPVHKLFAGTECLAGHDLSLRFLEFHRNDKLRMTHRLPASEGGLPVPAGFDIEASPYVRDSSNGGGLVDLRTAGASTLLVPVHRSHLVRTVDQAHGAAGTRRLLHFTVPPRRTVRGRPTRFVDSTLEIPAFGEDRLAPEYVNIRQRIDPAGPVNQAPVDLNALSAANFRQAMTQGGYAAAHFADDTCDGCVEARVDGLPPQLENLPAFSLVTAPDFFPLADQFELETDPTVDRVEPLSKGRLPVNPQLPRPSNPTVPAFERVDRTVTAVVGATATGPQASIVGHPNRAVSFLPDSASNVFAPGWDSSRSRDALGQFLTSSGLGSPFPEDAKLCAALASFWPAVAPDNGRTFGNVGFGNQLPMLDAELGFHPRHPRVLDGTVASHRGWDGEFGPFFERIDNEPHVNFVPIERSDYVVRALQGQIKVSLTAEVQTEDLIARHQALAACHAILQLPSNTGVCLVVVERVADWSAAAAGVPALAGTGFLLEFAEMAEPTKPTAEIGRVVRAVRRLHVCQVGSNGVAYRNGGAAFVFHAF